MYAISFSLLSILLFLCPGILHFPFLFFSIVLFFLLSSLSILSHFPVHICAQFLSLLLFLCSGILYFALLFFSIVLLYCLILSLLFYSISIVFSFYSITLSSSHICAQFLSLLLFLCSGILYFALLFFSIVLLYCLILSLLFYSISIVFSIFSITFSSSYMCTVSFLSSLSSLILVVQAAHKVRY